MTERRQMYQNEVWALADPANRPADWRWGQTIINTYPDYFTKKPWPELWNARDDDVIRAIMNSFFYDNQIPVAAE